MLNLNFIYENGFEVHTKEYGTIKVISLDNLTDIFDNYMNCSTCNIPHNKYTGCPKLNGLIPPSDFICGFWEKKNG